MNDKAARLIPRKPDYNVRANDKAKGEKSLVGVAWKNPNDTISIKLDPFIVLKGGANLALTLYPAKDRAKDE
jgi:hypothetical protein